MEPSIKMWVNGDPIDPFDYYGQEYLREKSVGEDGKIKKLLVCTSKEKLVEYYLN